MHFREHEIGFREADRRYAELKRWLDAGSISAKEFDAQRLRSRMTRRIVGRGLSTPSFFLGEPGTRSALALIASRAE